MYIVIGTALSGLLIAIIFWLYIKRKDAKEVQLYNMKVEQDKLKLISAEENPLYRSPITKVDVEGLRQGNACVGCRASKISNRSSISPMTPTSTRFSISEDHEFQIKN
uniref:Putative secreted protein n=1 Tax=Xenopsylla cheopis TaxID=163159 RepID=A0A6M2DZF3_XENCH